MICQRCEEGNVHPVLGCPECGKRAEPAPCPECAAKDVRITELERELADEREHSRAFNEMGED